MKALPILLTVPALGATGAAATAQAPPPPYVDTACGGWQGDTWVPNGSCTTTVYRHEVLAGTIVSVKGHLVTLQQAKGTVVFDDSSALRNQDTGRVAVGRQIIAHGYWVGDNFYATTVTGGQPAP
jgi:hypothetical protein